MPDVGAKVVSSRDLLELRPTVPGRPLLDVLDDRAPGAAVWPPIRPHRRRRRLRGLEPLLPVRVSDPSGRSDLSRVWSIGVTPGGRDVSDHYRDALENVRITEELMLRFGVRALEAGADEVAAASFQILAESLREGYDD